MCKPRNLFVILSWIVVKNAVLPTWLLFLTCIFKHFMCDGSYFSAGILNNNKKSLRSQAQSWVIMSSPHHELTGKEAMQWSFNLHGSLSIRAWDLKIPTCHMINDLYIHFQIINKPIWPDSVKGIALTFSGAISCEWRHMNKSLMNSKPKSQIINSKPCVK